MRHCDQKSAIKRTIIAITILVGLAACEQEQPFTDWIPPEIEVLTKVYEKTDWGVCSVQVYEISSNSIGRIDASRSALKGPLYARKNVLRSKRGDLDNSTRYKPWMDKSSWIRSLHANTGVFAGGKIPAIESCLAGYSSTAEEVYSTESDQNIIYTNSVYADGSDADDMLIIIRSRKIIIVSPH